MIILWLRAALIFLAKLFIPAPKQRTRIDPNAPCPACGNEGGEIETVRQGQAFFVEHTCYGCKCRWYEDPISNAVKMKAKGE